MQYKRLDGEKYCKGSCYWCEQEGNELLDIFRFKTEEQVAEILADPAHREHVGEELADTLFFILRFCAAFGFDPGEILVDKICKNGKKYPVKK